MSDTPLVTPAGTAAGSRSDLSLGIGAAAVAVTAWGSSGIIVRFLDMGAPFPGGGRRDPRRPG